MATFVPLPFALPLLFAALLTGAAPLIPRRVADTVGIAVSAAVTAVCAMLLIQCDHHNLVYWFGGWRPVHGFPLGISFSIQPLGAGLAILASTLVLAAFVYSWHYFDAVGTLYHALLLVFLSAMCGFCLTGDLFNLFVCFELMSTAAFALTGYKVEDKTTLEGSLNFAVTNTVGAFFVLMGIGLLYARTGVLNLAQIGQALAGHGAGGLVLTAFMLIIGGLLIKAAVAPFQFWLADAHAVAPTPICALFSGVMEVIALFGIARIYWIIFESALSSHAPALRGILLGFGVTTTLIGGVMCFLQRNIKRLLAFSTVSHIGIMLCGIALLDGRGLAGTALYALGHGLVKAALFFSAGLLLTRFSTVDEMDLRGQGRDMRWSGWLFLLGALGLAGCPPFPTALGRSVIEATAGAGGDRWLPLVLLLGGALTGGAVLRVAGRVYLGWGPDPGAEKKSAPGHEAPESKDTPDLPPHPMLVPPIALLALALAAGLWPHVAKWASRAAPRFADTSASFAAVLHGAALPPISPVSVHDDLAGVLWSVAATLLAFVFAGLALSCDKLPSALRRFGGRVTSPVIDGLQTIQSGDVRDYVAWLVLGMAAFGGLLYALMR